MINLIFQTVDDFLKKYDIKSKRAIVAFSAGPDSCALALALNFLKEKHDLKLALAYFNHGWRKEAILEEKFTENFAKKINVDFYIEKAPLDALKTEEAARDLRYDFFKKTASEFGSDVVFLAHNKNDNVETLLYRVIKGTSPKGLCSIPEKREIFYRPFLNITKKEILDFLNAQKQEYMLDSSNEDTKYKRNLIRKEILPLFEKINPNYIENINNLIKTSNDAAKIVEKSISKIKNEIIQDEKIDYEKFVNLEKEIRYEILNDYLKNMLKYRNYKNIKKFDDFILNNQNSKTSINSNQFLKIKKNKIFVETIEN